MPNQSFLDVPITMEEKGVLTILEDAVYDNLLNNFLIKIDGEVNEDINNLSVITPPFGHVGDLTFINKGYVEIKMRRNGLSINDVVFKKGGKISVIKFI